MRLSLNTITIKNAGLEEKFRLAATAGFEGLELWGQEVDDDPTAPEKISRLAQQYGLVIEGVCPQPDLYPWHYQWDSQLETAFEQRLARYGAIGAQYLVLPVIGETGTLDQLAANLIRICDIAVRCNLAVGLEPIGHVAKLSSVNMAFDILAQLESEAEVGIILDVFHFFRGRNKLTDLQGRDPATITTVHINDAMNLPLDELVGYRHRLYPGEGIFDGLTFCAALHRLGYDGPYVVEILNEAYWQADPAVVSRRAYQTAQQLLENSY